MKEIELNKDLIAACGLYCGSCRKYLQEKCSGCNKNEKASWCKVRSCCIDNKQQSCADCKTFSNAVECKKLNNPISKIFSLIFKSDRGANIKLIKEKGYDHFAKVMTENKTMTLKK